MRHLLGDGGYLRHICYQSIYRIVCSQSYCFKPNWKSNVKRFSPLDSVFISLLGMLDGTLKYSISAFASLANDIFLGSISLFSLFIWRNDT